MGNTKLILHIIHIGDPLCQLFKLCRLVSINAFCWGNENWADPSQLLAQTRSVYKLQGHDLAKTRANTILMRQFSKQAGLSPLVDDRGNTKNLKTIIRLVYIIDTVCNL